MQKVRLSSRSFGYQLPPNILQSQQRCGIHFLESLKTTSLSKAFKQTSVFKWWILVWAVEVQPEGPLSYLGPLFNDYHNLSSWAYFSLQTVRVTYTEHVCQLRGVYTSQRSVCINLLHVSLSGTVTSLLQAFLGIYKLTTSLPGPCTSLQETKEGIYCKLITSHSQTFTILLQAFLRYLTWWQAFLEHLQACYSLPQTPTW